MRPVVCGACVFSCVLFVFSLFLSLCECVCFGVRVSLCDVLLRLLYYPESFLLVCSSFRVGVCHCILHYDYDYYIPVFHSVAVCVFEVHRELVQFTFFFVVFTG